MLLEYQQKFLGNDAKIKVWRKSRQIGATWTLAFNSCITSGRAKKPLNTWFSSTTAEAGKLFVQDVADWARKLNTAVKEISLEEKLIDKDRDIKATGVDFFSGKGVYSLSSSPRNFRGKRGDVILDEFAFHDNQRELWKASTPATRWGGSIYTLSSVGLEGDFFEELCDKAKKTKSWYYQETNIEDAIKDGLVEAIWKAQGIKKSPTRKDKELFLQKIRDEYVDEESFLQEYMCIPASSEASQWLTWDLITGVESREISIDGSKYKGGKTVIGNDIAARKDKWVAAVFEIIEGKAHLVELKAVTKIMQNNMLVPASFEYKEHIMRELVKKYNPYRIYVDQTGMGEKITEDYKKLFGNIRVQGVIFNQASMEEMAINAKQKFEDKKVLLPFANTEIRTDLRLIKKELGVGNKPKFVTERNKNGHGDIAWAIFLALLGIKTKYTPYKYVPVYKNKDFTNYEADFKKANFKRNRKEFI